MPLQVPRWSGRQRTAAAMLVVAIFVLGYFAIIFEHQLKLNKSASALLTGVLCWTAYVAASSDANAVSNALGHHLGEVAGIVFFLLGAMTIVELIDAHDGFEIITSRVTAVSRRRLLATIAFLAFFMSAVLDNLTTSIVMMSLVRKLASEDEDRMYFGSAVIIAANAGGAWSPIGDVTTTMLWVGGQITSLATIKTIFLPSLVSVLVPLGWIAFKMKGNVQRSGGAGTTLDGWLVSARASLSDGLDRTVIHLPPGASAVGKSVIGLNLRARTGAFVASIKRGDGPAPKPNEALCPGDELEVTGKAEELQRALTLLIRDESPKPTTAFERVLVLFVGVAVLLFVPVFKTLTHLPPFMGILLGLGVLWTLTELIHKKKNDEGKGALSVAGALQRVDTQSVLFFLGILVAIGSLQENGTLPALARGMDSIIGNVDLITVTIGLASAVVDNVPLVAAAQGMYTLTAFPTDDHFWLFLAYCAGTGGSILIIGSAAGIAVMGLQRISFGWYLRRISLPALVGYLIGAATYVLLAKPGG